MAMQVLYAMVYFWPVTTVAVVLIGAIIHNCPTRDEKYRYLPLVLLVFPPIFLFWGAVFAQEWSDEFSWAAFGLFLLLIAQLVVTIAVLVKMKGRWWYAFGFSFIAAYFGLLCWLIATMSVTGDWI